MKACICITLQQLGCSFPRRQLYCWKWWQYKVSLKQMQIFRVSSKLKENIFSHFFSSAGRLESFIWLYREWNVDIEVIEFWFMSGLLAMSFSHLINNQGYSQQTFNLSMSTVKTRKMGQICFKFITRKTKWCHWYHKMD